MRFAHKGMHIVGIFVVLNLLLLLGLSRGGQHLYHGGRLVELNVRQNSNGPQVRKQGQAVELWILNLRNWLFTKMANCDSNGLRF